MFFFYFNCHWCALCIKLEELHFQSVSFINRVVFTSPLDSCVQPFWILPIVYKQSCSENVWIFVLPFLKSSASFKPVSTFITKILQSVSVNVLTNNLSISRKDIQQEQQGKHEIGCLHVFRLKIGLSIWSMVWPWSVGFSFKILNCVYKKIMTFFRYTATPPDHIEANWLC